MSDHQIFFMVAVPIVILIMCGMMYWAVNSGKYNDSGRGPELQDTFEEIGDDK